MEKLKKKYERHFYKRMFGESYFGVEFATIVLLQIKCYDKLDQLSSKRGTIVSIANIGKASRSSVFVSFRWTITKI